MLIRNGLYRIVWRCSHCTETPMPLGTAATLSVSVSVSVSVNAPFSRTKKKVMRCYSLFTLPDLDSDSECRPNGYIVICGTFHTVWSHIQIPIQTAEYRHLNLSLLCKLAITSVKLLCVCFYKNSKEPKSSFSLDCIFSGELDGLSLLSSLTA